MTSRDEEGKVKPLLLTHQVRVRVLIGKDTGNGEHEACYFHVLSIHGKTPCIMQHVEIKLIDELTVIHWIWTNSISPN